jgi:hypothetical protein
MRGNIFSPEYILSNAISLLVLLFAIRRPFIARIMICIIFIGAAVVNGIIAIAHPAWYLVYGDLTASPLYEDFIKGAFGRHISAFVLSIAVLQLVIGVGAAMRGWIWKAACTGAFIFLLAVAPLGAGSAFPCTIILAIACLVLLFYISNDSLFATVHRKFLKS